MHKTLKWGEVFRCLCISRTKKLQSQIAWNSKKIWNSLYVILKFWLSLPIHHICNFFSTDNFFGFYYSPHRKCVDRNKIEFATKQRKWQMNRFCNKTSTNSIHATAKQCKKNIYFYSIHLKFLDIQNFSTYKISPHLKYLHI